MKFTNGYWLTWSEYDMSCAAQVYRARREDNALSVLAATRQVAGNRGAALNMPALELSFSSPMDDVICVEVVHFKGELERGLYFDIERARRAVDIRQTEQACRLSSGGLKASLPDLRGGTAAVFTLEREGETLTVSTDSPCPFEVFLHGMPRVSVKSAENERLCLDFEI